MVAVVVGMAALAVDGARAYALRRDLQAATDAAALAAADSYQQYRNYTSAESAATTSFGQNIRLYVSPSCSPAYGAPPRTITCNYSDHTVLTEAVTALGAAGVQFTIGATRSLVLQFARILTSGSSPQLTAIASAGVNNLLYTPTVAALSQAGCGGMPGNAITTTSAGILNIVGDMVSSGAISIAGSASITGDVYARCQSSVTGVTTTCYPSGNSAPCTYPDVVGVTRSGYNFADPRYPAPPLVGSAQPRPPTGGGPVVLAPGSYAMDPALGPGFCYFLAGGVYKWQGGYTNNGSFVSNELRPPDEPMYNNNTVIAGHQLWDTDSIGCSGSFQVSSLAGFPVVTREGTWAFVITSVRSAIYNGVSYIRESAPSMCRTVSVGDNQVVQIQVSNVPGAVSYNVYAAPPNNGCSGPFGLAGSIAVAGSVQNTATGACPAFSGTGCSLGHESAIFDAGLLGVGFNPNALAAPGVAGSYPPDSETAPLRSNLPNENANRATPPHGDRANENQCDTVAAALTTCAGPITPGAVAFVIPSGGCLNDSISGDNVVFSGYQYNWMVVYEPGAAYPPANTCSNFIGAATDSAFIGFFYAPSAAITISKASTFRTDEVGGVMAFTLTFSGQLPTILGDPAEYGPVPPAAKLTS